MKFIVARRRGIAGLLRFARGLVWVLAACAALAESPTYGAAVAYSDYVELRRAAFGLPGINVNLSFRTLDYVSLPSPVTISNIVFNGRWFLVQSAFNQIYSQGQLYLSDFESDVPLNIHFPTGARAFGAFFSSWIGPQFTTFTGTVTTDHGDKFMIQCPTDFGSEPPTYLGLVFSDSVYDITFDDGGIFVSGGYNYHQEMVADVFAVLNPVPSFDISRSPTGALNFQVDGATGQTVVLLSSTNLTDWQAVVTNKLTSPRWVYTGTSQTRSNEFFRLNVR